MDYCSTCRRHLNGALVCPGCGAYAPDIAPNVTADSALPFVPGPAADPVFSFTPPDVAPGAVPAGAVDGMSATATDGGPEATDRTSAAAADAAAVRQRPGRAARRRQRARWKKTQRRALVATAVALVGGGLTVASLDRHTAGPAQAAPAPSTPHTDSVGRQPAGYTGTATGDAGPGQASPASPARPSTRPAHQSPTTAPAPRDTATAQNLHPYSAAPHTTAAVPAPAAAYPSAPARQPDGSGGSVTSSGASGSSGTSDGSSGDRSPGTTTQQTQQTSQPAASDGSGSGTAQSSPTTAPSPASPSSTSPHLCLLVLCLG
ncbi:SCO2400 family protein [Streptomyces sp. NPDC003393]